MSKRPELEFDNDGEPTAESRSRIADYDAKKIAQLTADNERLRGVLQRICDRAHYAIVMQEHRDDIELFDDMDTIEHEARQALTTTTECEGDEDGKN